MRRESEIVDNMGSVCEECKLESLPLIKAAEYGHEECVLSLIKAGTDVNERDSFHHTALINATETGTEKCAKEPIKAGADVNAAEHKSLMYAAMGGNLNLVKMLIDAGAFLDDRDIRNGRTALIAAAWNGHHQCVDALIEAGADVNIASASRRTAVAIYTWGPWEEGHYKCIESLTAAGADVNVPDEFGWNSGNVALFEAGSNGDARKIRLYLKSGVYINDTEIYGNSALEQLINNWPKTPEEADAFKEVALLLLAAGERIANVTGNIPEYLQPTLTLKDMCRRAIRNR